MNFAVSTQLRKWKFLNDLPRLSKRTKTVVQTVVAKTVSVVNTTTTDKGGLDQKVYLTKGGEEMKFKTFTFNFKGGPITVLAFNYEQAKILAQAEAIKRAWDYTIIEEESK